MRKKLFVSITICLLAVSTLSACGSADGSEAAPATVTVTATVTAAPPEPSSAPPASTENVESTEPVSEGIGEIGEIVKNHGVALTVKKAYFANTVPMNRSGYQAGSSYAKFTQEKADAGGKFVVVETTIENVGKQSLDLTCGWPIEMKLGDSDGRAFDPIDDLSDFKGNPECNAQLQPGFKDSMTYAFLVPTAATVTGLVFRDTNAEAYDDFAAVAFEPASK